MCPEASGRCGACATSASTATASARCRRGSASSARSSSFGCRATRSRHCPRTIGRLGALRELHTRGNGLTHSLIDPGLRELRVLDLRDNALTELPRELGELRRLRTLDLRANPLRSLPDDLAGMEGLEKLDLRWTPFFPDLPAPARALEARGCVVLH